MTTATGARGSDDGVAGSARARRRDLWRAVAVATALLAVATASRAQEAPRRVVSINLCTDRLALTLARPEQVVSVSRLSLDPDLSDVAEMAARLPVNDGRAEEIVPLAPDLVLAGSFTARSTVAILRRLGYRVEEFAPPRSFADIRADVERMGRLLGRGPQAASVIAAFDGRIAALRGTAPRSDAPSAVVYHVGDRAEGRGTLADEILATAGWRNLAADLGIEDAGTLPLEVLVMNRPDAILVGSAEVAWSTPAQPNHRHPVFAAALGADVTVLPDRWSICGSTAVADVVEQLVDARRALAARARTASSRTGPVP